MKKALLLILLPAMGAAPAPQESAAIQPLVDALGAVGRIRYMSGRAENPCILLVTPSGQPIIAAPMNQVPKVDDFEAVFRPDSPEPKVLPTSLLGQTEAFAFFKVEGAPPVKPVDIRSEFSGRPGGTVLALGTRPGRGQATINQMALGVLHTIRFDDKRDCLFFSANHMVRDLFPVAYLDPVGRLAGLASRVGPSLTPTEILDAIEGSVSRTQVERFKEEEGRLKAKLSLALCNPLGRLKSVTALVLQHHLVKDWPRKPEANGRWLELGPKASEVRASIAGSAGTLDIDLPLDTTQPRTWVVQYRVVRGDGTVRHSQWGTFGPGAQELNLSFSRRFEEGPVLRPNPQPGQTKPAAIPPSQPVATGLSLLAGIETVRGAQITRTHGISARTGFWSPDCKFVYVLDLSNVVRKISVPEFREVCEYGIGYGCSDLRPSAEGPVVHVAELGEVWVLSSANLSIRSRTPVPGHGKLSTGPSSSIAWMHVGLEFVAIDLGAGRVAKRHTLESLEAGAIRAVRPAQVERLQVSTFEVAPNSRTLLVAGNKQLHRFAINGNNLSYEEVGPEQYVVRVESLVFSPDSYYVSAYSNGRSRVYRTAKLDEIVVEYSQVELAGFDKAAEVLYGVFQAAPGMSILRADGTVERTIPGVREKTMLVYPDGNKVLLIGNELSLVEILE